MRRYCKRHVKRLIHDAAEFGAAHDDGGIDAAAQRGFGLGAARDDVGCGDLDVLQRQRAGEGAVGAQLFLARQARRLRTDAAQHQFAAVARGDQKLVGVVHGIDVMRPDLSSSVSAPDFRAVTSVLLEREAAGQRDADDAVA